MFTWDPAQYRRYEGLRLRPALDLLAQVDHPSPRLVYDLGTGSGDMAHLMATRWPEATVIGTDTSAEMLATAAATPSPVEWLQQDVIDWSPPDPPDIIYSNAMLHWVPDHDSLLQRLGDSLATGGVLAIQMPLSWAEPSHRMMRTVLATSGPTGGPLGPDELRERLGRRPVDEPGHYYRLLAATMATVEVWTTRYFQVLEGPDPVFEWVQGSALRPVLQSLNDAELDVFLGRYRRELRAAYKMTEDGMTLFPFLRVFIVARKR